MAFPYDWLSRIPSKQNAMTKQSIVQLILAGGDFPTYGQRTLLIQEMDYTARLKVA